MNELIKVGAKVRDKGWEDGKHLIVKTIGAIWFIAECVGHFDTLRYTEHSFLIDKDWVSYEEPKKKVMMYPALIKDTSNNEHFITLYLYETIEQYENQIKGTFYGRKLKVVKLLTDRGIEVEV